MSELLLQTIIDKLNMQSQDIETIKERAEMFSLSSDTLKDLSDQVSSIEGSIKKIALPEKEIKQLSFDLNRATSILQQPVKNEFVHNHYVPKLLWITAGLFLILCLVCSGWYMTHDKLQDYIAGDTKYRYLKLDSDKNLKKLLFITDSLYRTYPKMREDVIKAEEEKKERAELQRQAEEKQKEADDLRLKASQRKK